MINNNKICFVICGCSGSGKSTLSKILETHWNYKVEIVEADQFFYKNGIYQFNPRELGAAHSFCREKFTQALKNEIPLVICSNTNTRWENERKFYVDTAKSFGYAVFSLIVENVNETKDSHGVPEQSLKNQEQNLKNSLKLR